MMKRFKASTLIDSRLVSWVLLYDVDDEDGEIAWVVIGDLWEIAPWNGLGFMKIEFLQKAPTGQKAAAIGEAKCDVLM